MIMINGRNTVVLLVAMACCLVLVVFSTRRSRLEARPIEEEGGRQTNPFLPPQSHDPGWPSVRGPHLDGNSRELSLANSWPAGGPPVLWSKKLGQGYSAFVAARNRVYTQYQTLRGQFVVCLDARTGQTVWEHRYDWPFEPAGLYPGPRSTPTLDSGRVYFATPRGRVGCLDGNGQLLWSEDLKTRYDGQGTDFGYACSPMVVDGMVIMPVGGVGASMVALDARNGVVVWKSGSESSSYASALPVTVNGHRQVIGYLENTLVCFDLQNGDKLWQLELSKAYDEHAAWPVYDESYLWISGPFRAGSQLLRITGGTDADFERIWQSPLMSNDVASSVLVDGFLYGFDLRDIQSKAHRRSRGSFRCLEFLSGRQRWSNGKATAERLSASTNSDGLAGTFQAGNEGTTVGHATVIAADGKLILFNDSGETILAQANPDEYHELARASVLSGEICWTPPALHRGCLYLRNQSRAVCMYLGKPELLERSRDLPMLTVRDIPQTANLDLSEILGIEPEYALDPPSFRWLWSWFGFSLGIIVLAGIFSAAVANFVRPQMTIAQCRWLFWAVAFLLGIAVAKPLSLWRNDFVFTWPVSLFVAFQAVVYQVTIGGHGRVSRGRPWRGRLVAAAFMLVCFVYYAICRQLSLITEWIFLCGFPGACAVVLVQRKFFDRLNQSLLGEVILTMIAFSVFFWSSVALLSLKYDIAAF